VSPENAKLTPVVDGLPLDVLQADYQQSQIQIAAPQAPGADTPLPASIPDAELARAAAAKAESKLVTPPTPTSPPSPQRLLSPTSSGQHSPGQKNGIKAGGEVEVVDGVEEDEQDEDDEEEIVKGVFWEDRQGNIRQIGEE
jgi:hypothetical protein